MTRNMEIIRIKTYTNFRVSTIFFSLWI